MSSAIVEVDGVRDKIGIREGDSGMPEAEVVRLLASDARWGDAL